MSQCLQKGLAVRVIRRCDRLGVPGTGLPLQKGVDRLTQRKVRQQGAADISVGYRAQQPPLRVHHQDDADAVNLHLGDGLLDGAGYGGAKGCQVCVHGRLLSQETTARRFHSPPSHFHRWGERNWSTSS